MKDKILYQLTVEDFQNVAQEEIGRELTKQEITIVLKSAEQKFDWYSAIMYAIWENIESSKK